MQSDFALQRKGFEPLRGLRGGQKLHHLATIGPERRENFGAGCTASSTRQSVAAVDQVLALRPAARNGDELDVALKDRNVSWRALPEPMALHMRVTHTHTHAHTRTHTVARARAEWQCTGSAHPDAS